MCNQTEWTATFVPAPGEPSGHLHPEARGAGRASVFIIRSTTPIPSLKARRNVSLLKMSTLLDFVSGQDRKEALA
jgi:hypothetical protein